MKRVRMKKAENPTGLSYFFCGGKTCDRESCLLRCHSLDDARKDPLMIDFIAKVKQNVLASNGISSDNPTIELLDRCKTLEEAKEDPLLCSMNLMCRKTATFVERYWTKTETFPFFYSMLFSTKKRIFQVVKF